MSAFTDRLSEDDIRWLVRMNRVLRARIEARREREREHSPSEDEGQGAGDGAHDAA